MTKICVICKKKYIGWGNNAQPVKKGLCCDACNMAVVIPIRINKTGMVLDRSFLKDLGFIARLTPKRRAMIIKAITGGLK